MPTEVLADKNIFIAIRQAISNELKSMDLLIKSCLSDREELIPIISDYLISSGGKRIRPILTLLSSKLFNYTGKKDIKLAAAIEFIHTATLLHDDVVDESLLRRGKASAKEKWGNKASILVGDFLFSQAFKLMSETENLKVLNILSSASAIIAEGEVMQLTSSNDIEITMDKYLQIISAKTAELFASACQVGANLANVNQDIEENMYQCGLNIGIAFQIIDDVLDYSGNEENLGKKIGDDFYEHKVTLPVILAYKDANIEEKAFWQHAFSSPNADLNKARMLLDKYDCLNRSGLIAIDYCNKAKINLEQINIENEFSRYFIDLIDFTAKRVY